MANRKRNIQMKFYVTEEEKRLIVEKMAQLPTQRYGAYLRKMAIDGFIIYTDTTDIKAFHALRSPPETRAPASNFDCSGKGPEQRKIRKRVLACCAC